MLCVHGLVRARCELRLGWSQQAVSILGTRCASCSLGPADAYRATSSSEAVFEHDLTCSVMNDVFPELAVPQVLAYRRSR